MVRQRGPEWECAGNRVDELRRDGADDQLGGCLRGDLKRCWWDNSYLPGVLNRFHSMTMMMV